VIGTVYRAAARNAHGDPVDTKGNVTRLDGDNLVGTVTGLVMGGQSVVQSGGRQESSDTSGQIGVPTASTVRIQFGDRVDIDGVRYQVTSRPEWDHASSLTGTTFGHYWVRVTATI
jgi:hypothetical protein